MSSGNTKSFFVGALLEASSATGIGGNQADNAAANAGAVYVFARAAGAWSQQAYVKASNTGERDQFGWTVALSADGNTLAVGANFEDSNATGVGGDQNDNSAEQAGAVYVFRFDGTDWFQQTYIKGSNPDGDYRFGTGVALSADGNTLAVGTWFEDSNATGINGDQSDNSAGDSGAVYLFRFDGTDWSQQAYVKASNTEFNDAALQ